MFYGEAGKELDRQEKESLLSGLRASRVVQPENYPLLVTFDDITKPETVKRVDPDDLAATFGAGYALEVVTLEITDEAVTQGRVEAVLGWIDEYYDKMLDGNRLRDFRTEKLANRLGKGDFKREKL